MLAAAVFFISLVLAAAAKGNQPNMIWIVTDDQDQMLGGSFPIHNGATPMPKTQRLMAEGGTTALNFFVHTPICSPSRSELLSGRYFHNIKQTGAPLWAMHVNDTLVSANTFAKYLNEEGGYTVGMFGKYVNNMPKKYPVPGFDAWLANNGGHYISPEFQTTNIDGLPGGGWKGSAHNYTTSVVGNVSIAWIKKVAKGNKPFFAYIAPKAAHEPFNPAPWYVDHWDPSWPAHEPRPASWNCSATSRKNHPTAIREEPMISPAAATVITDIFKNRWRTLMSVDDLIADVIAALDGLDVLNNTYIFYSSDHGFQLGEFNILMDKRHVYDFDTRVHLLARGPGIKPGSTFKQPATMVDMTATFLGLAGVSQPPEMDGRSLAPFLVDAVDPGIPESVAAHLVALGDSANYTSAWRDCVFLEYYFVEPNVKCVAKCDTKAQHYPHSDSACGDLDENTHCWSPVCVQDCHATESLQNNFIALRHMPTSSFGNTLYAEYQMGEQSIADVNFAAVDFHEYHNLTADPWQMHNAYSSLDPSTSRALHEKLQQWFNCRGAECP